MTTERIDIVVSQKGAKEVRRDIEGIGEGAVKSSSNINVLKTALGSLSFGLLAREVARLSDAYTTIDNRLRLATKSAADLQFVQKSLFEISQRTRSEFETNVQLYSRLSISAKELGAQQGSLLKFTEAVGNALAIGGGSTESTRGALIQLSQAIGTTIVRAEEFNSILEGAPRLAKAAADGLDKAGGSVAKLRLLIANGKVTSKEFFDAILSQSPKLAEEFAKTNSTIAQSFLRLNNALVQFVGTSGSVSTSAHTLSTIINALADNVNLLANAFLIVVEVIAVRYIVAMGRAVIATAAQTAATLASARAAALAAPAMLGFGAATSTAAVGARLLTSSLAFFGGPIGLAITATLVALTLHTNLAAKAQEEYNTELHSFRTLAKEAQTANGERAKDAKAQANAIINAHIAELESLNTLIEGYANSNSLLLGLREIAGKVGIGTAPSEQIDKSYALAKQIANMRKLLQNPDADTDSGGAGVPPSLSKAGKKTKAQLIAEENAELSEQIRLLGYSGLAHEAESKYIEFEKKLREQNYTLTAQESTQLREKITLLVQLNEQYEYQTRLYDSLRNPMLEYTKTLAAANALLKDGKITTEEYDKTVRDLRISLLDTATDTASGFERGLLKVQKEFSDTAKLSEDLVTNMAKNMEDAFVELATTGKLNFKSLIDGMIADLARLTVRQNITGPLFNLLGLGGASSGGSLGASLLSHLPSFDIGTESVPRDMIAKIHKDEKITPAAEALRQRSSRSQSSSSSDTYQVNNTISVTVQGGSRDSSADQGAKIAQAVQVQLEQAMSKFVQKQSKTNGLLNRGTVVS